MMLLNQTCHTISRFTMVLILCLSATSLLAHPETTKDNCHFHTSSGEQHCAGNQDDAGAKGTSRGSAVVQPLLPTKPNSSRSSTTNPRSKARESNEQTGAFNHLQLEEERTQLIADIQEGLARLGYEPGPPMGDMNGLTELAIKQFQEDNFLPTSGQPSLSLLTIIEEEVAAYKPERR